MPNVKYYGDNVVGIGSRTTGVCLGYIDDILVAVEYTRKNVFGEPVLLYGARCKNVVEEFHTKLGEITYQLHRGQLVEMSAASWMPEYQRVADKIMKVANRK